MINSAPTHRGSAIYVLKIPWEEPGRKLPGKSWPPEQGCPDVGGGRDETRRGWREGGWTGDWSGDWAKVLVGRVGDACVK